MTLFTSARRTSASLFDEDFDHPPPPEPPPEPEVIEPVYTAAELEAARAEGWREGHAIATEEARTSEAAVASQAMRLIAEELLAVRHEAADVTESASESLARLIMASLAAAFPALCRSHGEAEVTAIVRILLPALHQEPNVVIRVAPAIAMALEGEIACLDPDLLPHLQIIPTDAVAPGDIRIAWRGGGAARNTAALWQQIESILAPAGLLPNSLPTPDQACQETISGWMAPSLDAGTRSMRSPEPAATRRESEPNPATRPQALKEPEHVE